MVEFVPFPVPRKQKGAGSDRLAMRGRVAVLLRFRLRIDDVAPIPIGPNLGHAFRPADLVQQSETRSASLDRLELLAHVVLVVLHVAPVAMEEEPKRAVVEDDVVPVHPIVHRKEHHLDVGPGGVDLFGRGREKEGRVGGRCILCDVLLVFPVRPRAHAVPSCFRSNITATVGRGCSRGNSRPRDSAVVFSSHDPPTGTRRKHGMNHARRWIDI